MKGGHWAIGERYRWEPAGQYRTVELPGLHLVALLGVQPARLLLLDPESMQAVEVPLAAGGQGWIEPFSTSDLVVFGDNALGLVHVERDGSSVRLVERWGAIGDAGSLSAGVVLPRRELIVAGDGTGHLVFVALPALRSIPGSVSSPLAFLHQGDCAVAPLRVA